MSSKYTIAIDTETGGLDWWDPDQQAFLITWSDASRDYLARVDNDAEIAEFKAALKLADRIVFQNAPFDVHQIRATLGIDLLSTGAELWDTKVMAQVLHPAGQSGSPSTYNLKHMATVYLRDDATDPEDDIKRMAKAIGLSTIKQKGAYHEVWRAYPEVMERYAMNDTRITYDLFEFFTRELEQRPELARVMELERRVVPILIRAEERGVRINQKRVAEIRLEQEDKRDVAAAELVAEGFQLDGDGTEPALIEALQNHGVPLYRRTATGQLATNKFALQEFEDDFPIVGVLQRYREANKLIGTYLDTMSGVKAVHPSFQSIGAWTRRMSCRRPNMQNVPKGELRSVIVPRRGYSFIVADYDAIEMRLLAYYLGREEYRDLVSRSDPHAWMASEIWGGLPADYAKGGPRDEERSKAKNGLFAICYGAGAPRITDMFKLDPGPKYTADDWAVKQGYKRVGDWKYDEAKALISDIKEAIPGFTHLQSRIKTKVKSRGYVNTIFGGVNPVGKDKAYVGLNALIQGSAAEVMKQGLINVASAIEDFDAHVLLVVHDEVVVECRKGQAKECEEVINEALIAAADIDPPLAVTSAVVSTHYGDAK